MRRLILFLLILILISSTSALAADWAISNSEDWKDVFSTLHYANLKGINGEFLVSQRHASIMANTLPSGASVDIISSKRYPFTTGFDNLLRSNGIDATEYEYDSVNLELAKRLPEIHNYVVVDGSYGYNAISVAPYGIVSKSYVLFADSNNINDISSFMANNPPDKLILYGHVDREVKAALTQYNPEIINMDGDRFDNNLAIVKKYLDIKPMKQVILTNGEFIEKEVMSGAEPVMFIGQSNVPDQVRQFIDDNGIEVGVLIGNQYVGSATTIKRQAGISVFVKFARSARVAESAISPVEGLDMFYVPSYALDIEIVSIRYNQLTGQLEVTLRNKADVDGYFLGSYRLTWGDGERQTIGDREPIFIAGGEYKTVVYDVSKMTGNITVIYRVVFGESKRSLESSIEGTMSVEVAGVSDNSQIRINWVKYDTIKKMFLIEVENIGDVDTYVDLELVDIMIAGEKFTFSAEKTTLLKKGEKKTIRIRVDLDEEDFPDNLKVFVNAYYGQREQALVKLVSDYYDVSYMGAESLLIEYSWTLAVVAAAIIFLLLRRKKKCPNCKTRNNRDRTYCIKCGTRL